MHCSDCSQQLSMWLDELLDQEQAARLQDHLAACEGCRAEWEAMRRVSSLLETEPSFAPAPDFTARVVLRLQQRDARRRRVRSTLGVLMGSVGLWAIAGMALLLLFGLLWRAPMRIIWSSVVLPVSRNASSVLPALTRAVASAAYELATRPSTLLVLGYALLAVGLTVLWTRIVFRPRQHVWR